VGLLTFGVPIAGRTKSVWAFAHMRDGLSGLERVAIKVATRAVICACAPPRDTAFLIPNLG